MRAAVVAAAGSGWRFGAQKQFLELRPGVRLVDEAVLACRSVADWVGVVLPAGVTWDGPPVDAFCEGGGSRLDSLRAGLALVPPEAEVIVTHSASHPLASSELIAALCAAVANEDTHGAVPFLPAVDVIKRLDTQGGLTTVGRANLGAAQCPMAFEREILQRVLTDDTVDSAGAVEESALVEASGGTITAIAGEVRNIHVVDLDSLEMARALAASRQPSPAAAAATAD